MELAPVRPDEREADGGPIVPRATPSGAWVPVVMVHGWTARSTHPNADGTEDTQGTFSHLIDFTANRSGSADVGRSLVGQLQGLPGAAVFTFDYHPYSGRWVTDEHLGPALVKVVNCLAKASGQKVIVVGHSMGGLVGRFAATDGGRGSDSIAQLVTMGTPNQGSIAAMVTAAAADVGAVVDRRLAVLRLLLAECGRVSTASMDGASLCNMLPAFVRAFDGEAGKALRFGSKELKSLNARSVPSDITVNALAGSTLMSVPRMGWFGWSWETDTVDIGDVVVDHASATKPSSTIDDISCAYQMSPVRGLADTAGLVLKVRTLNEVGDVPWNLLSGPCFHNALPRSIELTNAVMALVREEIEGRPGVLRDARSCGAIDPGFAIEGVTDNPAVETARAIYDAAVACDSEALTRLAVRDQTELSLGVMTVDEAFAIPNSHDRYWAITRMLSLPPYVHSDNISWPYRDEDTGEVDWDGPDASGQLSTQDLRRLEEGFWSLSIRYDGTWAGMFQGD